MRLEVDAAALSDVGRTRRSNEDFFGVDPEHRLYLVADGMGGHGNGEIASRLVVDSVRSFFEGGAGGGRRRWPAAGEDRPALMREAIERANESVLGAVDHDRSLGGMGTTLVALRLGDDGTGILAHVGDSRAYRLRENRLRRLTSDHTWVNEQLTAGNLSEAQARDHPFKSVVTRALGGDERVDVERTAQDLAPGDRYQRIAAGVSTKGPHELICRRLSAGRPLRETCRQLVDDANDRGGRDNITVVLVAVEDA
ncbi:MAG: protein phosphatase 2C domain-containing protein [Thermoanaerobaculia bacterium]|nr:protein phosphatase 2C domain-containing protein [Thermoanaerobaculia bacterium]